MEPSQEDDVFFDAKETCKEQQSSQEAPPPLTNEAIMYKFRFKKTLEIFDTDKAAARERCLELLINANLPRMIECQACHLLAFCSPPAEVFFWLDKGLEVIDEMDKIKKTDGPIRLRQKNELLRNMVKQQLAERGWNTPEQPSTTDPADKAPAHARVLTLQPKGQYPTPVPSEVSTGDNGNERRRDES